MTLWINGDAVEVDAPVTVAELLQSRGYNAEIVAVGLNGAVVSRMDYGSLALKDRDEVELFHFMGGGGGC